MNTKIYKVGSWEINYLSRSEYISWSLIEKLEKWINKKWLDAVRQFPSEEANTTWGGLRKFRIPSPIIRVEMSPLCLSGGIEHCVYSIAKRPALLRVLAHVAHQFPEHRQMILRALDEKFCGIIQMGDMVQDDCLLAKDILRIPYFNEIPEHREGGYYWVRTDPHKTYSEKLLEKLESISLVPVRADGCNTEFISLGMARRLSELLPENLPWQNIDEDLALLTLFQEALPWDTNFVIKPVQGTWGENVFISHHADSKEKRNAEWVKIKNLVKTIGPHKYLIQPYIPDRSVERDGKTYHEIFRLYFAYVGKEGYSFTGGMVQGSPARNVCGIEDTYFIPLFMK